MNIRNEGTPTWILILLVLGVVASVYWGAFMIIQQVFMLVICILFFTTGFYGPIRLSTELGFLFAGGFYPLVATIAYGSAGENLSLPELFNTFLQEPVPYLVLGVAIFYGSYVFHEILFIMIDRLIARRKSRKSGKAYIPTRIQPNPTRDFFQDHGGFVGMFTLVGYDLAGSLILMNDETPVEEISLASVAIPIGTWVLIIVGVHLGYVLLNVISRHF